MSSSERTRGYVRIDETGARFYLPYGGRWMGGSRAVQVREDEAPGWYRALAEWHGSRFSVELGRQVDPLKEAERLEALADKPASARTGSPGIKGYVHMENMANEAIRVRKQTQRHFAKVLRMRGKRKHVIGTVEFQKDGKRFPVLGKEREALLQKVLDGEPLPEGVQVVAPTPGGPRVPITADDIRWDTSRLQKTNG